MKNKGILALIIISLCVLVGGVSFLAAKKYYNTDDISEKEEVKDEQKEDNFYNEVLYSYKEDGVDEVQIDYYVNACSDEAVKNDNKEAKNCYYRRVYINDIEVEELKELLFSDRVNLTRDKALQNILDTIDINNGAKYLNFQKLDVLRGNYYMFQKDFFTDETTDTYLIVNSNGRVEETFDVNSLPIYIKTETCTDYRCSVSKECSEEMEQVLYGVNGNIIMEVWDNAIYYVNEDTEGIINEYRISEKNGKLENEKINSYEIDGVNVIAGIC